MCNGGEDVEDVQHRKPHVIRAPARMTWGSEPPHDTDLEEVAQPHHHLCATSPTSGCRGGLHTPHGLLASSQDVGFPLFDLFEVTHKIKILPNPTWQSTTNKIILPNPMNPNQETRRKGKSYPIQPGNPRRTK